MIYALPSLIRGIVLPKLKKKVLHWSVKVVLERNFAALQLSTERPGAFLNVTIPAASLTCYMSGQYVCTVKEGAKETLEATATLTITDDRTLLFHKRSSWQRWLTSPNAADKLWNSHFHTCACKQFVRVLYLLGLIILCAEHLDKAQITVEPEINKDEGFQEGNPLKMTCTQIIGPINDKDLRTHHNVSNALW